ncbi:MAG TPA: LAGLIDADG family homing endonuclease [Candidatus Nanoarchaeia archaeon]|nr:LAGLIDADG family homing endonuclease [Candidatus Nanoarchaeia archaeon]
MRKEKQIAEFIGVMLGDGSIGIYNTKAGNKIKKQYVVKVTLDSRNKKYIRYVSNLMKDVLNVEPKICLKKNENTADIRTFRRDKFEYITKTIGLKISPKWNSMEIPKNYMKEKLYPFILRGLFDTDGSVTIFNNNGIIYPRIEIKICPSPAQQQFLEIIKKLNFNYTVQNLDKGEIRVRISGKNELNKWFTIVGSSNDNYLERMNPFLKKGL